MGYRVKVGDRVVRSSSVGAHVFDLVVKSRTANTISTDFYGRFNYSSPVDKRGKLQCFRLYEEAKVEEMQKLETQIGALTAEFREIYQSLPKIE